VQRTHVRVATWLIEPDLRALAWGQHADFGLPLRLCRCWIVAGSLYASSSANRWRACSQVLSRMYDCWVPRPVPDMMSLLLPMENVASMHPPVPDCSLAKCRYIAAQRDGTAEMAQARLAYQPRRWPLPGEHRAPGPVLRPGSGVHHPRLRSSAWMRGAPYVQWLAS
jgi:hypothetical protein